MGLDAPRDQRHRLLPEIGDRGVLLLRSSTVSVGGLDARVAAVAESYLVRAGVEVTERPAEAPSGPSGRASDVAEDYLLGALFALEHVARTVGQREGAPAVPDGPLLEVVRGAGGTHAD